MYSRKFAWKSAMIVIPALREFVAIEGHVRSEAESHVWPPRIQT
jgi:hypothetical protein